jgi:predicted helicase
VDWSKFSLAKPDNVQLRSKKKLRKHQKLAITKVTAGFQAGDRGKLIMACGTGKTFTSLKLMESLVPDKGLALFLVPSISLLSQTLKEWMAESEHELRSFAVCSDTKVGKDQEDIAVNDLAYPATTDAKKLPRGDQRTTQRGQARHGHLLDLPVHRRRPTGAEERPWRVRPRDLR